MSTDARRRDMGAVPRDPRGLAPWVALVKTNRIPAALTSCMSTAPSHLLISTPGGPSGDGRRSAAGDHRDIAQGIRSHDGSERDRRTATGASGVGSGASGSASGVGVGGRVAAKATDGISRDVRRLPALHPGRRPILRQHHREGERPRHDDSDAQAGQALRRTADSLRTVLDGTRAPPLLACRDHIRMSSRLRLVPTPDVRAPMADPYTGTRRGRRV